MSFFRNLWCLVAHGRYTSQRSASGDWCVMHCRKCGDAWSAPRL
jgi:hypothetical protein